MHKNFSSDRKVLEDAIHEMTKIDPPEGQLWVDFGPSREAQTGQKRRLGKWFPLPGIAVLRHYFL
jgi:hypothetical protein